MGDAAITVAIIGALASLAVSLLDNRRLRHDRAADRASAEKVQNENSASAVRIREIEATEELRDDLRAALKESRETIKEQAHTIRTLGEELEKNRTERLKFERERLAWQEERAELQECVGQVEVLQKRVGALERSLGEAAVREDALEASSRTEREAWAIQRRGLETRIRSLELALKAAGVPVPREQEATG